MKLAEALITRADLQKRVQQLRERLNSNAKVQEGEKPAEEPSDLLKELDRDLKDLNTLIKRINRTNCETRTEKGSLTDLLADRDILAMKISILRDLCNASRNAIERYSLKEIKVVNTVNVKDIQKNIDGLSKTLRESEVEIQSLNWATDLL